MVPITEYLNMICHNITLTLGNILICTFPCIKGETKAKRERLSCSRLLRKFAVEGGPEHGLSGSSANTPPPSGLLFLCKSAFVRFSLTMMSSELCKVRGGVTSDGQIVGRSLEEALILPYTPLHALYRTCADSMPRWTNHGF